MVGELLFKVSGISGKTSDGDEEDALEATVVESSRRALLEVLGAERRDHILAALYLIRQDGVVVVRQASIQIWKALVSNTPRTGTSRGHGSWHYLILTSSARNSGRNRVFHHLPHFERRARARRGEYMASTISFKLNSP